MKSKIRFIYDDKEFKRKKETIELIKEHIREYDMKLIFSYNILYDLLVYSKYIIEKENLDVSQIIKGNTKELIDYLKEEYKKYDSINGRVIVTCFDKLKLYEVLKKIIYDDYEIRCDDDRFLNNYLDKDKKYLLVANKSINFINLPNVDIYVKDRPKLIIFIEKLYDEIVGIKRKHYESLTEIDYRKYDEIIYLNNGKEFIDDSEILKSKHHNIKEMLMVTNYSIICRQRTIFSKYKTISIDKDKVYIEFRNNINSLNNQTDDRICIKELSNVSDDELKQEIINEKEKKDICIYASIKDVRENSYGIGFKAYNKNNSEERTRILKLIAYNERLTEKIRVLDNEISFQINKMIVR